MISFARKHVVSSHHVHTYLPHKPCKLVKCNYSSKRPQAIAIALRKRKGGPPDPQDDDPRYSILSTQLGIGSSLLCEYYQHSYPNAAVSLLMACMLFFVHEVIKTSR